VDSQLCPAFVGKSHAHARVLHGAGDAGVSRVLLIDVLYRQQGLLEGGGAVGDLAVGEGLPRLDGVAEADLPGGDAHFYRQQVDVGLQGKFTLAHTESAERARGRIIGIIAETADIRVLVAVRPNRVGTRPLKHGAAQ